MAQRILAAPPKVVSQAVGAPMAPKPVALAAPPRRQPSAPPPTPPAALQTALEASVETNGAQTESAPKGKRGRPKGGPLSVLPTFRSAGRGRPGVQLRPTSQGATPRDFNEAQAWVAASAKGQNKSGGYNCDEQHWVIHLNTETFPKDVEGNFLSPKSGKAGERFLYEDGMTVAQALSIPKGPGRQDLRFDESHGFISITRVK